MREKLLLNYVTFHIKGDQLINFFQYSTEANIPLWNITLISKTEAKVSVHITHFNKIKNIANHFNLTIVVKNRTGLLFFLLTIWKRKERVIAIILSLLFLFYMSNIVWNVNIIGVSTNVEMKIDEHLKQMGIYKGAFFTSRISLDEVEANLMEILPQLLYINVKKHGTIYTIEAKEKQEENITDDTTFANLVASKSGVIKKMLIKDGQAVIQVNDLVKKGDLLVKGSIDIQAEQTETEEENEEIVVGAKGEIFANTWYEVTVTTNLITSIERLEGNKINYYYVRAGNINIPLLNFKKVPFVDTAVQVEQFPLTIWNKELPLQIIRKSIYNKAIVQTERTKKEAIEKAIDHALIDLEKKLGKDAQILKYYILHEAVDNGKVKLRLYVSALENIAQTVPIK